MDARSKNELNSIKKELDSIINELESISYGVRNDFVGIGSENCANSIDKVLNNYYTVRRKLHNIDTSTVTKSYAQTHGSGSSF